MHVDVDPPLVQIISYYGLWTSEEVIFVGVQVLVDGEVVYQRYDELPLGEITAAEDSLADLLQGAEAYTELYGPWSVGEFI